MIGSTRAPPHQQQVVGRHGVALAQTEAGRLCLPGDIFQRAQAPLAVLGAQAGVKGQIAWGGRHVLFQIRPIGHQHSVCGQVAGGAAHQCHAAFPGRNVDHVGAVNQVKRRGEGLALAGPLRLGHVQPQRRQYLLRTAVRAPSGDRREQIVLPVGGLPAPAGQGGTKVRCVLPCATGNLQGVATGGEQRLQRREDGALLRSAAGLWAHGGVCIKKGVSALQSSARCYQK